MDQRSQSLSLLDEIKDLASREAKSESLPQNNHSITQSSMPIPKQNSLTGLGLELTKALADVHESVSLDAQREEQKRTQSLSFEEAKRIEAQQQYEQRVAEEVEMRLASERARQQAIQEERRLKHLRLQYEAALARGENVEMPLELRPPEPVEMPVIQSAVEKKELEIQEAEAKNQKTFLIGGLVALVLIMGGVWVVLQGTPEAPVTKPVSKIEVPQKPKVDIAALELEAEKKRQAQLKAERLKQEEEARLKAEADAKAKKLAAKKRRKRKRNKAPAQKKKIKFGKDLLKGL